MTTLFSRIAKGWKYLWEHNSWWSLIVVIVLVVIGVKFVFFPIMGWLLGSSLPVVAVVSGSMEHPTTFESWWEYHEPYYSDLGITKEAFLNFPFPNGFNTGDVIFLSRANQVNLDVGDVIVYNAGADYPIIHRIVSINDQDDTSVYQTKGDNNPSSNVDPRIALDEFNVQPQVIIGKAWFRIPVLGYVKKIASAVLGCTVLAVRTNLTWDVCMGSQFAGNSRAIQYT